MSRPTCQTCPYWEPLDDEALAGDYTDAIPLVGECRRYAPRPLELARVGAVSDADADLGHVEREIVWVRTVAHVGESCWCGEHPDFPDWVARLRRTSDA